MCVLQSRNQIPTSQGTVRAAARASYACPTQACTDWVREEGFQGMRTLSVESGEQPSCPLCRQPVAFARKSKRGE
jgi:hypothetical protein